MAQVGLWVLVVGCGRRQTLRCQPAGLRSQYALHIVGMTTREGPGREDEGARPQVSFVFSAGNWIRWCGFAVAEETQEAGGTYCTSEAITGRLEDLCLLPLCRCEDLCPQHHPSSLCRVEDLCLFPLGRCADLCPQQRRDITFQMAADAGILGRDLGSW